MRIQFILFVGTFLALGACSKNEAPPREVVLKDEGETSNDTDQPAVTESEFETLKKEVAALKAKVDEQEAALAGNVSTMGSHTSALAALSTSLSGVEQDLSVVSALAYASAGSISTIITTYGYPQLWLYNASGQRLYPVQTVALEGDGGTYLSALVRLTGEHFAQFRLRYNTIEFMVNERYGSNGWLYYTTGDCTGLPYVTSIPTYQLQSHRNKYWLKGNSVGTLTYNSRYNDVGGCSVLNGTTTLYSANEYVGPIFVEPNKIDPDMAGYSAPVTIGR